MLLGAGMLPTLQDLHGTSTAVVAASIKNWL